MTRFKELVEQLDALLKKVNVIGFNSSSQNDLEIFREAEGLLIKLQEFYQLHAGKDIKTDKIRMNIITRFSKEILLDTMTYREQLSSVRWREFADFMRSIAGHCCQHSDCTSNVLQVHHKRYILGRMAWEYNPEDILVLCREHHILEHSKSINVYKPNGELYRVIPPLNAQNDNHQRPCPRCSGDGWISSYSHVSGGICFLCWGTKWFPMDLMDITL